MKCAACHNAMLKKKGEVDLRIDEKGIRHQASKIPENNNTEAI